MRSLESGASAGPIDWCTCHIFSVVDIHNSPLREIAMRQIQKSQAQMKQMEQATGGVTALPGSGGNGATDGQQQTQRYSYMPQQALPMAVAQPLASPKMELMSTAPTTLHAE